MDTTKFVSTISCKNGQLQSRTHLSIQKHKRMLMSQNGVCVYVRKRERDKGMVSWKCLYLEIPLEMCHLVFKGVHNVFVCECVCSVPYSMSN